MSDDFIDFVQKALISGTSCAVISAILNPFDVTKIRLQNQPSGFIKYKGMMSGARVILLEEGVAGLSKGMTPSMLRELSYSSVRFGAYEPIRETVGAFIDGPSVKPQVRILICIYKQYVCIMICTTICMITIFMYNDMCVY